MEHANTIKILSNTFCCATTNKLKSNKLSMCVIMAQTLATLNILGALYM